MSLVNQLSNQRVKYYRSVGFLEMPSAKPVPICPLAGGSEQQSAAARQSGEEYARYNQPFCSARRAASMRLRTPNFWIAMER